jgi:23S rRNA pseudouridine2605 synthase
MPSRDSSPKKDFEPKSDKPFKRNSDSASKEDDAKPYRERKDSDSRVKPATWEKKSKDSGTGKSESKPYREGDYTRKDSGDKPSFSKSYKSHDDKSSDSRDKPSYGKPYKSRDDKPSDSSDKPSYSKSYKSRDDKPTERREDKPYEKRSDKPYEKRGDKPFEKSSGVRRDGKPYKEKRSFATETGKPRFRNDKDAPWDKSDNAWNNPPEEGFEKKSKFSDKSYGDKPRFERKGKDFKTPFAKRDDKPRKFGDDGEKSSWSKRTDDAPKERDWSNDSDEKSPKSREIKEVDRSERFSDRPKPESKGRFGDRDKPDRKSSFKDKKGGSFDKPSKERTRRKRVDSDGTIRLNRYIANAGICSRREADTLIESGVVKVNGVIVTTLGTKVGPDDKVQYGDQTLSKETKRYLLLNKPKDYITTAKDPEGRRTVAELIVSACHERLYPVGRLDRATTGLLLFTNDGELAKRLTHPSHEVKKMYHVTLDKNLKAIDFKRISEGLELEDGKAEVDEINYVEGGGKDEVGISLHSGKNRIVRRIFEHLGYDVVKLDRVLFAGLTKKDLPRGKFRFLTEKEINMLRMI